MAGDSPGGPPAAGPAATTAAAGDATGGSATVADLLLARAGDDHPALWVAGDSRPGWTWRQVVRECAARGAWMRTAHGEQGSDASGTGEKGGEQGTVRTCPQHVAVLLSNIPEFVFLIGGAALTGQVIVALNTTRSPAELAADAKATDCDMLLHEPETAGLANEVASRTGLPARDVTSAGYVREIAAHTATPLTADAARQGGAYDLVMLIFTSGTSGRPRAVRITNRKIVIPGVMLAGRMLTGPHQHTVYSPMPLFHSGAIMAAYAPALAAGACLVLRRTFSASNLLSDVRAHGCTYLHYVGKALSYVLATPERPDDHENPLLIAFGNEASPTAVGRFARRFGCRVVDGYGSTETGVSLTPDPNGPPGALGRLPDGVKIIDPVTGRECPPARIAGAADGVPGRLLNGEAIGELVNVGGVGLFDGYYSGPDDGGNPDQGRPRGDATAKRGASHAVGRFHSGDLAYADADGFVYFAGRQADRLRVDGENISAAAVEEVLRQFPDVIEAAVYPVPDPLAGDQVMAALVLAEGAEFSAQPFGSFLGARADIGAKQLPRFVRITGELPQNATGKVLKRRLVAQAWNTSDPVWYRPGREPAYRLLTDRDIAEIHEGFRRGGRLHLLEHA